MSALLSSLRRYGGGTKLPPVTKKVQLGANVYPLGQAYYDPTPVWTNMAQATNLWKYADGTGNANLDNNRDPTEDVTIGIPYVNVTALPFIIKGSFNGQANAVSGSLANNQWSVANWAYNSSSNTTTFDVQATVIGSLGLGAVKCLNTKRISTSAINTGLTNIRLMRPGYETSTATFTSDFLSYIAPLKVLRTMDWTQVNNEPSLSSIEWNGRNIWAANIIPYEKILKLGLDSGSDIWLNIPLQASNDYVTQLATLTQTLLQSSTVNLIVEVSNEVWNITFGQFFIALHLANQEINGFVGGDPTQGIISATVTNNTTLVLAFTSAHNWTNGQTIYVQNNGDKVSVAQYPVVTVIDATHASVPCSSYANGVLYATVPSSWRCSGGTNGSLANNELTAVSPDPYAAQQNYVARRAAQVSNIFRMVWGDAAMHARIKPVFMWQARTDFSSAARFIPACASLGNQASYYLTAVGQAPYVFFSNSVSGDPRNTISQNSNDYVVAYDSGFRNAQAQYQLEKQIQTATRYGMKFYSYEGGSDSTGVSGSTTQIQASNQARCDAFFDARLLPSIKTYLQQHISMGGEYFAWYGCGLQGRVDNGSDGMYAMTDDFSHITAVTGGARVEAIYGLNANVNMPLSRNVVPGNVDGRLYADSYSAIGDAPSTALTASGTLSYSVVASVAGTYSLTVNGSCLDGTNQGAFHVSVNGVDQGVTINLLNHTGAGGLSNLFAWADANTVSITLSLGLNALDLVPLVPCDGNHQNAINALRVVYNSPLATPVNTVAPVITGTAKVGQTLTVSNGTWTGAVSGYKYQWGRTAISGYGGPPAFANGVSNTYVPVASDVGFYIFCIVTAYNVNGGDDGGLGYRSASTAAVVA